MSGNCGREREALRTSIVEAGTLARELGVSVRRVRLGRDDRVPREVVAPVESAAVDDEEGRDLRWRTNFALVQFTFSRETEAKI